MKLANDAALIVHLIPYDGIGGVERAAASMDGYVTDKVRFKRQFVFNHAVGRVSQRKGGLIAPYMKAVVELRESQPDLVVLSLWRSVIVGLLARLVGARMPMVLFLHNSRNAHVVDKVLTLLAVRVSDAVWADSEETLGQRVNIPRGKATRVISFLTAHREPAGGEFTKFPEPKFVFWGRLAPQKDLPRAIRIFDCVRQRFSHATFTVIGPESGHGDKVRSEIERLGLGRSVRLVGAKSEQEIRDLAAESCFFLQASTHEGMCMSVVEAMQYGLVPIVTPVGEIARYTTDGLNSIWIGVGDEGERAVCRSIAELLGAECRWRRMREAALQNFVDRSLYVDDFVEAGSQVLSAHAQSWRVKR